MIFFNIFFALLVFSAVGAQAQGGTQMTTAEQIIKKLELKPLPGEGGYYRETYRSTEKAKAIRSNGESGPLRHMSTAIFYLVTPDNFSAIHRISSDEVFHFYGGDPVEMIQISDNGEFIIHTLGANILEDESPQVVVPQGVWQGLRLKDGGSWALLGTTVSPGFEFVDFELGTRNQMLELFPKLKKVIELYTRE